MGGEPVQRLGRKMLSQARQLVLEDSRGAKADMRATVSRVARWREVCPGRTDRGGTPGQGCEGELRPAGNPAPGPPTRFPLSIRASSILVWHEEKV